MPDPVKSGYGANQGSSAGKSPSDLGTRASELKSGVGSGVSSAPDQLSQKAKDAKNAASDLASQASKSAGAAANQVKQAAGSSAASLKDQAAGVATDARSTVSAMAEEARHRITEIVDQQKAVGADTVAGVARAAQSAAGDLERTSPQLARLVRTAAEGADRIAGDLRSSDLNQIVGNISRFGRRQPVAFFGGAVLVGFILARFLKSDAQPSQNSAPSRDPRRL